MSISAPASATRLCFEELDREIGVGDRVLGIGGNRAAERCLGLDGRVPCRFQEADAVPDLGLSRRDVRRLLELGKGTLDVALDLGAAHGARVEDLRVLRVDGAGPVEGPAHRLAAVERKGELRREGGDACVAGKALPGKLQLCCGGREVLAKTGHEGMGEGRRRIAGTKLGRSLRP